MLKEEVDVMAWVEMEQRDRHRIGALEKQMAVVAVHRKVKYSGPGSTMMAGRRTLVAQQILGLDLRVYHHSGNV